MAAKDLSGSALVMLSQRIENIEKVITSGDKDNSDESSVGLVLGVYVPPAHRTTGYSLGLRNLRCEAFLRFAWGTYTPRTKPVRSRDCRIWTSLIPPVFLTNNLLAYLGNQLWGDYHF